MIEVLEMAAEGEPTLPAVISEDGTPSYRELLRAVSPATGLQFLALPNGARWVTAFWSAVSSGEAVVPLNPRGKPDELDHIRADALAADLGSDQVSVIQYTAGTSGRPKGALLSADGLLTVARGHAASWRLEPGDTIFIPNPMSHIMGLVLGCLMPAVARATVVTMERFEPTLALQLIERYRPVAMAGTPTHFSMLAEHPDLGRRDISSLRFGLAGGASASPEAVQRVTERLGLEALLNGYGMSEACGSISRTELGDPVEAHALTVGRPMPWLETRLVEGELSIRGAPIAKRYAGRGEPSRDSEGWFATGDLFDKDDEGRLIFKGRARDVLSVGGFNVYPAEIERVLGQHAAILQAQVVGIPDERLGELPVAFVRLRPNEAVSAGELREFCSERLSGYKVPTSFRVVEDFPVNSAGKVEKYRLREMASR